MARSALSMASLLATLPMATSRSLFSASAVASSSRTRPFSTTSPSHVQIKKPSKNAKHRQKKENPYVNNKATVRVEQKRIEDAGVPNFVLGQIESVRVGPTGKRTVIAQPYAGSRLQKTLVHPTRIWGAPIPDFAAGEVPANYVNGLTKEDQDLLFGALPHVTSALQYGDAALGASGSSTNTEAQKLLDDQTQQTHTLMKILDLRNSNRAEIRRWNKSRVLQVFADPIRGKKGERNTGSSRAQAALMTAKIRDLHEHLLVRPKDLQSKRTLRNLIHKRAAVLKYHKRKAHPSDYDATLRDLGLHPSTVEGELHMRGV